MHIYIYVHVCGHVCCIYACKHISTSACTQVCVYVCIQPVCCEYSWEPHYTPHSFPPSHSPAAWILSSSQELIHTKLNDKQDIDTHASTIECVCPLLQSCGAHRSGSCLSSFKRASSAVSWMLSSPAASDVKVEHVLWEGMVCVLVECYYYLLWEPSQWCL